MKQIIMTLVFGLTAFFSSHVMAAIPCPEEDPAACGEPEPDPEE